MTADADKRCCLPFHDDNSRHMAPIGPVCRGAQGSPELALSSRKSEKQLRDDLLTIAGIGQAGDADGEPAGLPE
jgi:hypothetical protein